MNRIVIGFLALIIHITAYADSSKRESVEELMEITHADSMIESMYDQMDQMFVGMGKQMGIQASEQGVFDNYMKSVIESLKEDMAWEKLKPTMIDIYLKYYTEKEIQDILTFYRTETGHALIEKMPKVSSESTNLYMNKVKEFMPKIKELSLQLKEDLKELRNSN